MKFNGGGLAEAQGALTGAGWKLCSASDDVHFLKIPSNFKKGYLADGLGNNLYQLGCDCQNLNIWINGKIGLFQYVNRQGQEEARSLEDILNTWKKNYKINYLEEDSSGKPQTYKDRIYGYADKLMQRMLEKKAKYSLDLENELHRYIDDTIRESDYYCCATYVAGVLYIAGYFSKEDIDNVNGGFQHNVDDIQQICIDKNFEEVSYDELQQGDIVIRKDAPGLIGHTGFFDHIDENGIMWLKDQECGCISSQGAEPNQGITQQNETPGYNPSNVEVYFYRPPNEPIYDPPNIEW